MGIYGNILLESYPFFLFKRLYQNAKKSNNELEITRVIQNYEVNEYKMKQEEKEKAKKMYNELKELELTLQGNNKDNKLSYRDLDDDYKEEIENILRKIVNNYNNDPKIKNKLKELKTSKLICDVFEDLEDEISFEICDDDQETRIKLLSVIDDIASDLKKELKNPGLNISTGDGDEGCIYISLIKEVYIMGIYGNYLLEGFFSKKKKEALTPSKSDYNLLSGYLKDLLNNKYSNIKKFCKITPFEIDKGDNSTPPSASLLHYDTYNKFDSYDDYEDKFDSDFNEMISELEKHFKNDKSIKIGVDGDEDSGTVYFYKYKI